MSLDADLVQYFAVREQQRDEQVRRILATLSDREQQLVREAAVMGYVRGSMAANPSARLVIPKDAVIVWEVIDACQAMPDLYRTITGWVEETEDDEEPSDG
jgi:ABC-type cobalamin transport system ATPase subunit